MNNVLNYLLGNIKIMLYSIPVLLIAFPVHELSHGLTAYKLGDPTAKTMGRLSLNPFKHLDPLGTICLVLFRFGWAKPVPVNPRNFKNPKAGMAATALAGPVSNLLLAFVSLILWDLILVLTNGAQNVALGIIYMFLQVSAEINIGLCIFNLIPMPPLDGEKILAFFLPESAQYFLDSHSQFFQILLLFLLFTPILSGPLNYMVTNVYNNLITIVNAIFRFFLAL